MFSNVSGSSKMRMAGLFSGLQTEELVKAMASGTKAKLNRRQQQLQTLMWRQEAYRTQISSLSSFQSKFLRLESRDSIMTQQNMNKSAATSSNPGIVASATSGAVPATYTISSANAATKATLDSGGGHFENTLSLDLSKVGADRVITYKDDGSGEIEKDNRVTLQFTLNGTTRDVKFEAGIVGGEFDKEKTQENFLEALNETFGFSTAGFSFQAGTDYLAFEHPSGDASITHTFSVRFDSSIGLMNTAYSGVDRNNSTLSSINWGVGGLPPRTTDAKRDEALENERQELLLRKADAEAFLATNDPSGANSARLLGLIEDFRVASDAGEAAALSYLTSTFTPAFYAELSSMGIEVTDEWKNDIQAVIDEGHGGDAVNVLRNVGNALEMSGVVMANRDIEYIDARLEAIGDGTNGLLGRADSFAFSINGKEITVSENATITELMNSINNSGAGVRMTFSSFTQSFQIESLNTGEDSAVEIADLGTSGLMTALFGSNLSANGKDSTITISNDGVNFATYTSKGNSFTFDGTTIDLTNLKESPTAAEPITVTTVKDHSAVKDLIVNFINDYNSLIESINKEISTARPKDKGSFFEPLTEEQEEEMDASQIEKWNDKAKQGLLFQDRHLNMLLTELGAAINTNYRFDDGSVMSLHSLGIAAVNRSGVLVIDEEKLDAALQVQGDKVAEFFTKSNDGLAARVNGAIDRAISTSNQRPGYLTSTAGIEDTTTDKKNMIHNQIQDLQKLIDNLRRKYEDEMARYWRRFTELEKHMARMNSQAGIFMPQEM
ncbi:MAG: flagellar filament capping protein FliD [Oscillospiraceae bacterium]|nr:flagellar filament capping protein FliD [Oscillospiraceae bacterium]